MILRHLYCTPLQEGVPRCWPGGRATLLAATGPCAPATAPLAAHERTHGNIYIIKNRPRRLIRPKEHTTLCRSNGDGTPVSAGTGTVKAAVMVPVW